MTLPGPSNDAASTSKPRLSLTPARSSPHSCRRFPPGRRTAGRRRTPGRTELAATAIAILSATGAVLSAAPDVTEALPSPGTSPLFWSQQERIVGFRNFDAIFTTRPIDHGTDHLPFVDDQRDFSDVRYEVDGGVYTLDHYLGHFHVAGALVARGESILFERYRLGHTETSRWVSFSVAKSVTSMLIGAAVADGYIESVEESVTDYLPRLKGSPYDGATIRDLLQMASGVAWNESYTDPSSDVALAGGANGMVLFDYLANLDRSAEPGSRFNYNTGETNLAGSLLRTAIGNNASSYLAAKIWRPLMEHPATWSITADVELGGCCIHATLRDYARIGLFALRGGVLPDGTRILPAGWMRESIEPSEPYPGYGYLWWLWGDGPYAAIGIFGQLIWIDPANDIVIVTQSAAPAATSADHDAHQEALVEALRNHVIALD